MSRLIGKNRDTRLVGKQNSNESEFDLGDFIAGGLLGLTALIPLFVVLHFVIKYW